MQLSVNKGGLIRSSFDRAASGQLGSPQTTMKTIWIWTKDKDVFTTSVESCLTTFIFTSDTKHLVEEWTCLSLHLIAIYACNMYVLGMFVSVSMYERLVWMQQLPRSSHCIWMVNSFWIQQTSRLQLLTKCLLASI